MADGTIKSQQIEFGTVITKSGVTFQSWGEATVAKVGKVVIFTFSGVRFSSAHTTAYDSFELPWRSVQYLSNSGSKDGAFVYLINQDSNVVRFNAVTTSTSYYGELIYFTND